VVFVGVEIFFLLKGKGRLVCGRRFCLVVGFRVGCA